MGMRTTLYGCIEEMDFWQNPISNQVRMHNEQVLNSLLINDTWPPVSREMFSTSKNQVQDGPNLEYSGRIIHFGANLKSVEYDWPGLKAKFESLLKSLFWTNAWLHLKTEYSSLETFHWTVDLLKYEIDHQKMPAPINESHWEFNGSNHFDNFQ